MAANLSRYQMTELPVNPRKQLVNGTMLTTRILWQSLLQHMRPGI